MLLDVDSCHLTTGGLDDGFHLPLTEVDDFYHSRTSPAFHPHKSRDSDIEVVVKVSDETTSYIRELPTELTLSYFRNDRMLVMST